MCIAMPTPEVTSRRERQKEMDAVEDAGTMAEHSPAAQSGGIERRMSECGGHAKHLSKPA